ncbi:hypothetical protein GCM10010315_36720 [Streptomyces luteosporeus]|uniref:Uncharacterized protein n=1 Tax=Streptomyces luteosporeus TaxID=173856 RepID=A0ABP6G8U3_9ACTN
MDFPSWNPRDLVDAATMNTRVRDVQQLLANPVRLAVQGVSSVTSVPDNGTFKTLKWDVADWVGAWSSRRWGGVHRACYRQLLPRRRLHRPVAGGHQQAPSDTADRHEPKRPRREELLRSYNSLIVPTTYVTCSLRGLAYVEKGSRLSLRVGAVPTTGEWEVSAGSRSSAQLNRFSAVLVDARNR